jgi:hypothetical protein
MEDGMRFHVGCGKISSRWFGCANIPRGLNVRCTISLCIHHGDYDSSTPVRRRHLAGADAKDRYAIIRLVGMAGSIKSRHRGFCFSAPISPPLLFSAQTEKIAFNAVGFRHVRSGIFGRGAGDQPAQPLQY